MKRTLLALAVGVVVGIGGAHRAALDGPDQAKGKRTTLAARDIVEKLDGKDARVTVVELNLAPGEAGSPHRHPGPVFGYVLEGEYEIGLNDQPAQTLKAGETFYEPTGGLHRVSRNPSATNRARVLAVLLHPRDAQQIAIPEPPAKKE
jgi:quercetin dioxygenase-like cupin family protein